MTPLMRHAFFREREVRRRLAQFVMSGDRLSMGEKCAEFERGFADYQGRKFATLFNSGGSANLALMQALRNLGVLSEGCRVAVSALTWATNVMPVIQMGFNPVPVDCQPETLNSMSWNVRPVKDVDALFITNALGMAGDLDVIRDLCRQYGIWLLEDNCESLGGSVNGVGTGNFGLASTFSFFVGHHLSTVEGGMVCTDERWLDSALRMVRANGWDRDLGDEETACMRLGRSDFDAKYTFHDLAFNLRPTEITGFLGLVQLESLDVALCLRRKLFSQLESVAKRNDDFVPLDYGHMSTVSPFAFPLLCKSPELRQRYVSKFCASGVESRPMIAGNIQLQPFWSKHVIESRELPGADFVHRCGFYCGLFPDMLDSDLATITGCLQKG